MDEALLTGRFSVEPTNLTHRRLGSGQGSDQGDDQKNANTSTPPSRPKTAGDEPRGRGMSTSLPVSRQGSSRPR